MAKQQTIDDQANTPVQGAGSAAEQDQPKAQELTAETPEWVQTILDSNTAVLDSNAKLAEQNQSVIDSLSAFKDHSAEFVAQLVEKSVEGNQPVIDSIKSAVEAITLAEIPKGTGTAADFQPAKKHVHPDVDYVVTKGNSFADRDDITKKYQEGEDVTHLGAERLQSLLDQGLIEEAQPTQ